MFCAQPLDSGGHTLTLWIIMWEGRFPRIFSRLILNCYLLSLSLYLRFRRKCDVDREPRDMSSPAAARGHFFPTSISTTTPGTPNNIHIKISTSPDISPTALSNSSSLSPPMSVANMMPSSGTTPTTVGSSVSPAISVAGNYLHTSAHKQAMSGIPCVAAASRYTAPVHIDVGGTIYTSSLETLTK